MCRIVAAAALAVLAPLAAPAADFPPISAEERALEAVAGQPGAPAVILWKRAALDFMDPSRDASSTLTVEVRLKVLSAAGLAYGDIALVHSRLARLRDFEGRTVLADGREVPLTDDAVFLETLSERDGYFLTKAAFPALEVGAIVDYRYTLHWDTFYYLEPWLFHDVLPVALSEIRYYLPGNVRFQPWQRETGGAKMEVDTQRSAQGFEVRATMRDLRAVPEEPYSFPLSDLASRVMMIPIEGSNSGFRYELLDSWQSVCDAFEQIYAPVRRKGGGAKKKARELAAGAAGERARIDAVHAFVRDRIRETPTGLIWPSVEDVDQVLRDGAGSATDQALLLQAMLAAVKVDSKLVWAGARDRWRVDIAVPNPIWFDRVLVLVEHGGERMFLDPVDRTLAPGRLAPAYEGTAALIHDKRRPEEIVLPDSAPEAHTRRAALRLALDAEGRLAGSGRLELRGHRARDELAAAEAGAAERWNEWLGEHHPGFEVGAVEVERARAEQRVAVAYTLRQRDEEVLGDEAGLVPSRPLGPARQLFELTPQERQTPVQFSDPGTVEEVEVELVWPAGWRLEGRPRPIDHEAGEVGGYRLELEVDETARRLTYRRHLARRGRELMSGAEYVAVRGLYAAAQTHDAQTLLLARD